MGELYIGYDDRKLEKEIEALYKDKEKAQPVERLVSKEKIEKEKKRKDEEESASSSEEDGKFDQDSS
ncbi:unnamed protein product [Onchocerca flexuosa]|uniref:Uncharacterized protein n=1 Tax=Onchocerca flexuosa TaxID=387005 RepID=A0A183HSS4_9BILA|nr:unnamed protein product [Onchocerca flexuosa]